MVKILQKSLKYYRPCGNNLVVAIQEILFGVDIPEF